jgi:hypothetical protein
MLFPGNICKDILEILGVLVQYLVLHPDELTMP